MTRTLKLVVLMVSGCNEIYGLDATRGADATVVTDRDGDGVSDTQDNCPDISGSHVLRLADASGTLQMQMLSFGAQRMLITLAYDVADSTTTVTCTAHQADGNRLTLDAQSRDPFAISAVSLLATNASGLFRALAIYD